MHRKRSCLAALLLLLLSTSGWASEPPAPEEEASTAPSVPPARRWHYLTRLEATSLSLLPRAGVGEDEGFVQVEPTFILDGGPEFGVNVGAPVRFRLWGGEVGAPLVRREDWDTLSDWGQLVRGLLLGSDNSPLGIWFGPLEEHRLLSGHLVRRYSNRTNPDYHPAGGIFTGTFGPLYTEAFASDVLGARLLGAEFSLDLEHILFGQPEQRGMYTLAVSAVHDWGRAGGAAPSMTLAHLDAMAVVMARPGMEAYVNAGWGGRPGEGGAWGAVVGGGWTLSPRGSTCAFGWRRGASMAVSGKASSARTMSWRASRRLAPMACRSRMRTSRTATPHSEKPSWSGMQSVTEGPTST